MDNTTFGIVYKTNLISTIVDDKRTSLSKTVYKTNLISTIVDFSRGLFYFRMSIRLI